MINRAVEKVELVCQFVIQLPSLHEPCVSVCFFYCMLCKHTHHYGMRNCSNRSPNMDPGQDMQPKEVGHRSQKLKGVTSFLRDISQWKGTAKLFYPAFLSQVVWWWSPAQIPQSGFKSGRLRCSADARITERATILGLLWAGHRFDCHACRNVKGGTFKPLCLEFCINFTHVDALIILY